MFSKNILLFVVLAVGAASVSVDANDVSLWDRLGGLEPIEKAINATVDLHYDDPITAPYFVAGKYENSGNRDYTKGQVIRFFSAGVGGPYDYAGKDLVSRHKNMVISESAFHAICYHLISSLEKYECGKPEDRDEVLSILHSLKNDVVNAGELSRLQAVDTTYDPVAWINSIVTKSFPTYITSLPIPQTAGDILNLSLDDWYSLLPLIITLLSPLILLQFVRKVGEAHDLENNSSGVAQHSGSFYSGDAISALPFILALTPGLLAIFGAFRGGSWTWVVAVVGYVLVPIVDLFLGEDSYNPTQEEEAKLKKNVFFRAITWVHTPLYALTIIASIFVIVARGDDLSTFELAGIIASVGIAGGFGIGCVHELIHRPTRFELSLGVGSCILANYSHFWIEHLWGHHKRVATDEDPASSKLGDNVYAFWVKCIYKSFVSALDIESRYLKKHNKSFLSHRILQGYTVSAIIAVAIYYNFGANALIFYLAQGVVVALHIENANFIEHYGLRRRKVEGAFDRDGEPIFEKPGWFHAWDTADRVTNWMLFKIQRHPDHHTNAGRPYQILRTFPQSPTMPTGYAGMFVLSWFPPLFRAVMDPLVERAYRQRLEMERRGVAASGFPKGSNNMSSFFKREGEGYFEEGSSPYADTEFYGSDAKVAPKKVWDEDYNATFEKAAKEHKIVEATELAARVRVVEGMAEDDATTTKKSQ